MRAGIIQQVDTPKVLYETPANLFVAGFIGSPAMNFVQARVDGDTIRLPFGDAPMSDDLRTRLQAAPGGHQGARDVIAGVRPEHFEDASLDEAEGRKHRMKFRAKLDVVESMGSELYAYFECAGEELHAEQLDELAADAGLEDLPHSGTQVVARLSAESQARPGAEVELSLDTTQIHLFDRDGGRSLTVAKD
jgi:multiple sugar transport system ATP-binding protein